MSLSEAEPATLLITGESGTGKTWLWRQLVRTLGPAWRSASVDLSQALDAHDFLRLVGHGLGLTLPDRLGDARNALGLALQEESHDGRTWLLIVENAHKASPLVVGELQALLHASEAAHGFSGFILTGPTPLVRLLGTREWSAVASRLETHVHLLPLDLDEARELASSEGQPERTAARNLEELHRDAGGNPRRLLHLLRVRAVPASNRAIALERPAPASPSAEHPQPIVPARAPASLSTPRETPRARTSEPENDALTAPVDPPAAPLVPYRPPLRVEDGLIEVGWEGNLEAESSGVLGLEEDEESLGAVASVPSAEPGTTAAAESASTDDDAAELPSEEMIEDHYAALQAWAEWARNRDRRVAKVEQSEEAAEATDGSSALESATDDEALLPVGLRAEPQHDHAPYSQLFTRLRQSS